MPSRSMAEPHFIPYHKLLIKLTLRVNSSEESFNLLGSIAGFDKLRATAGVVCRLSVCSTRSVRTTLLALIGNICSNCAVDILWRQCER